MPKMMLWESSSINPCPSCAALHGQIHSQGKWQSAGLKPRDHNLHCQEHCSCTLTEIDAEEHGDLSSVPLRGSELGEKMLHEATITLTAKPTKEGFEILAINTGIAKGHGITFGRDVLMQAVELYESIPVFIDHAGLGNAPSVRNLAGTITNPRWNEEQQGIQGTLIPSGPAKDVLLAVRDDALSNPAIMQAVGFSSVVNVQLDNKGNVKKIIRARSADVVIDPARGGKFLSAYSGQQGENTMTNPNDEQVQLTETQRTALELQGVNETIAELQSKQKQANEMLLAQCESLLETSLSASKLPAASQKAIKKQFAARIFKVAELQEAITEKREELSEINAASNVQGPGRLSISSMMTGKEEFETALSDLLGAEREEENKKLRVRPLSGIREAYLMATGDQSFMGGYYREVALVTANFPAVVANIQNKLLLKAWKDLEQHYGWWKKIATVDHFNNLNDVAWIRTGTIASLPTVAERGDYTELPIGDNKETDAWEKFGGYVPLTIEAVLRDDIRAFKRMPRELAMAGIRNISEQIAEIFTTGSAAGPTLADGGALFNATAVTTAGGHANLLTTALGTDYTAWNTVAAAMYNQPMLVKNTSGYYGTGKKIAMDPSFVLVPRALKNQAEALFLPRWEANAQNVATVSPSWGGRVEVLTVPEWTDATDWAAVIDPTLMPGIMIGEIFGIEPQIFSASSEVDPAMFANDESRIKVRQFLAVGVADYIPLHKSNVA